MTIPTKKTPKKPSKTKGGSVSSAKQKCPEVKYLLADFVEVVTQTEEKWVKGAAKDLTDTSVIKNNIVRQADADGNFRQYINIDRDVEGVAKRHPEYGRMITFRARVKRKDGKTEKLAGVKVVFSSKCVKAANRATADAKIWADSNLTRGQKDGFGSKGGVAEKVVVTDAKGWTSQVSYFVSQYAGDQYKFNAKLHPSVKVASRRPPMPTKNYEVWRKFWYQMTYAHGYNPPVPTTAVEAYKEVYAEMGKATPSTKQFRESDITNVDLKPRTFVKEYMVKQGGSATKNVAVIGYHNTSLFKAMRPSTAHKLTSNLIVAEYQCDSVDADCATAVSVFELTSSPQEITITGASIICKPPLKANSKLVIRGEWSKSSTRWRRAGFLTDSDIEIDSGRSKLNKIKVKKPAAAGARDKVFIKLKILATKSFAGCAAGDGQVVCVYKGTPSGFGSTKDFNETVAHELGHLFNQTPESAKKPRSLKKHRWQYVGHGGSGSHCRDSANLSARKRGRNAYIASQDANTTITKKTTSATSIHEVASSSGFIKGHKVKVKNRERVVKRVVDATHLKFTTRFTADIGDVVKQKLSFKPVVWTNKNQAYPIPYNGACVMYHQSSSSCTSKFCKTCKVYLQLQDMTSFK
ncbi:MAG: hypothetical protein GY799_27380 [Desulfobulbaceae bacterium]|nr:hypothetical protein [Desulfobulbaceae bacterium]